jgi:biotin-[acetyl-CoA-carboxylase] ligase BirA-like protein
MTLKIIQLDTVDSTNDYAVNLISDITKRQGAVRLTDTAILANKQTAGRGRLNSRTWISAPGNFHCSYIIRLDKLGIREHNATSLNSVTLHSVASLLKTLSNRADHILIKSPNDVMIHEKKVAGVLIEVSYPYAVIGIGINTVSAPISTSTSLLEALGIQILNIDVAARLHAIIGHECAKV